MLPHQPMDLQRQGFDLASIAGQRQLDLAAAGLTLAHLLPVIESFT